MEFEERLREVYADAMRFARGLTGSATDGDDLLQDALVRAWKAYPRLRDRDRFRGWLLKIISNAHRSGERRKRLKRWLTLDFAAAVTAPAPLALEEKEVVRLALGRLPRAQREALVLFEVLGMSVQEICHFQGTSPSAVKSRLSRGRAALRNQYMRLSREERTHETARARSSRAGTT